LAFLRGSKVSTGLSERAYVDQSSDRTGPEKAVT